ncbi:MAG: LacI family DNA-binding transcriptional regulator [Actinomycetota bacterium]
MTSRIEDVAQAAGVSTATVSRALRGLPLVSDRTRARVLKAAADLEYVASPPASSLASGRTNVVGVVVPYVTEWYFGQLISGASQVLRDKGFHALLFDLSADTAYTERELLLDSRMLARRVDAVIVLSLHLHDDERTLLRKLGIPVVTIGVIEADWPCVRIDETATTRIATQHLIKLGHQRLSYVGGLSKPEMNFPTPTDRLRGFEEAGKNAEKAVAYDTNVGDWSPAFGRAAGHRLFRRTDRPTAIVCASDEIAFGVIRAAADLGLNVPTDVSITGVDDHPLASMYDLTTVAQNPADHGRTATHIVLNALNGTADDRLHSITVPPIQLVVRSSTAPPPPPT